MPRLRWVAKAALQKGMSALPRADAANYWFQRHVTHGLPRPADGFSMHVREALRHLAVFDRVSELDRAAARFYEFGAGWDLIGPLAYWACGVDRQVLIDIRANLRLELVEDTLRRLGPELEAQGVAPSRAEVAERLREPGDLARFGIEYLAPRDARDSGLPSGSVDFVSSTYTMEHIPEPDLAAILRESWRLLAGGGAISSAVDFQDHYSYVDSSIGRHNFLRYGERRWRLVNSSLHYQNRLRLPDYRSLSEGAGLRIVAEEVEAATPAERDAVGRLRLPGRFSGYSPEDLTALSALFVARP
jgi:SAM-dependent methyltransferase